MNVMLSEILELLINYTDPIWIETKRLISVERVYMSHQLNKLIINTGKVKKRKKRAKANKSTNILRCG